MFINSYLLFDKITSYKNMQSTKISIRCGDFTTNLSNRVLCKRFLNKQRYKKE